MFKDVGFVKDIQESTQFAGRIRTWFRQKIEGAVAEMMAVGGIGIGCGRGKVWCGAFQAGVGAGDTPDFFHYARNIRQVFDYMAEDDVIEGIVFEWIKELFKVDNNVSRGALRDICTDCTGSFV